MDPSIKGKNIKIKFAIRFYIILFQLQHHISTGMSVNSVCSKCVVVERPIVTKLVNVKLYVVSISRHNKTIM